MVCSLSSCLSHAQLTVNLCGRADLSNATLYQNTELQARVAELEAELAAVKMAYTTATDVAALDKKAHNAQLSSLNKQMALTFPKVRFHMSIAAPCHCMNLPNRLKTRSSYV